MASGLTVQEGHLRRINAVVQWFERNKGTLDNRLRIRDRTPMYVLGGSSVLIGKLTASLSQGGSATFEPWSCSGGTFAATGAEDETVYDWLMKAGATALGSGKKIAYTKIGDTNVLIECECP